ncbi:chromate resistance protein (plasmid) [Ensifer adhaerens]|uniref:chromate resistance protein ChrB domain-containing protein n=1 Tax=Ensifer adhaerens TaxID=106592 RepID=UPI001CBF42F9|nr:chromate resistance protein ChrB domain-containing protein [Ensifer adhaerens]MBZ7927381.1 chromate resistance protein [Ensifer adhaerens]UAX97816.1 chromate resistance protein [Ensifer adhaerens]UAY05195.1 chromate resistance protein [Ensifer adhaerens]UAY12573.1 chromate resistance protein [Ensifer adhaerens]
MRDETTAQRWLLLIHQLPSKPAYFRVKIWRRLQRVGAVAVKSTVYALPGNAETQEDFEWLLKEIVEGGGEAMLCEARLIDGLSDAQARAMFDVARDEAYEAVSSEARALAATLEAADKAADKAELRASVGRLRRRLADIVAIDFFGAAARVKAETAVADLEHNLVEDVDVAEEGPKNPVESPDDLKGRVWVTREGVHVDRIACSWLIRRFIDPDAAIRFVPGKGYVPNPGEIRFDMFEGEITHEGDRCSFEVLLTRAAITDPALHTLSEIVHDIDLKDAKFAREETSGIASLIAGICASNTQDEQRIAQGGSVLDNLYEYFRATRA